MANEEREVCAIKEIEKWLNESKMQTQEGMVNEGIALDVGLDSEASTYDNTSIEQQDGSNSSRHAANVKRTQVDKVVSDKENVAIGPSFANNTLTKIHHSNNDTFENVFAFEILNHKKLEVKNCTKFNREARQGIASLTKGLETFTEKLFAKTNNK
ncbi:hypothetical protein Tco_0333575 [Tanacetum coccineum]